MNIDDKKLALFKQNWQEAQRTQARLESSVSRLSSHFPLSSEFINNASDIQMDAIDAFRVRFADLQDCIGNKLFKGILLLEEEQISSTLDTLNQMEKRCIITLLE